jgi:hypothetical protein
MSAEELFIHEHKFWLTARGFDDRGLQMPKQLENYLQLLKDNMEAIRCKRDDLIRSWKQSMEGVFDRGKYPMDFSFHYAYHPKGNEYQLVKMTGSMFGGPEQAYRFKTGRLRELPFSRDVFNKVKVEFVLNTLRAFKSKHSKKNQTAKHYRRR